MCHCQPPAEQEQYFSLQFILLLLSVEWSRSWHFLLEKMNLKLHYTSFVPTCKTNCLKWTLVRILPCTSLLPSTCLSLPCARTISCSMCCLGSLPSMGQTTESPYWRLHLQGLAYHKACPAGPASGSADNTVLPDNTMASPSVGSYLWFPFSAQPLVSMKPLFSHAFEALSPCQMCMAYVVWHILFRSYE